MSDWKSAIALWDSDEGDNAPRSFPRAKLVARSRLQDRVRTLRFAWSAAPGIPDADVCHVISPARVIVDGVYLREKDFVAVADVQKGVVMDIKFDAALRSDDSGGVSIVPCQADERTEVRNDDVGEPEVVI